MTKIKRILVSQPKPESEKHSYSELAEKNNLKIDWENVEILIEKHKTISKQKIQINVNI